MIKLSEGGFADIWQSATPPEVQSISYALQKAVERVIQAAIKTRCYSGIDVLPENVLDYFAVEMRAMYYDQSLPIDKKRAIIKNTLNWYAKAGTPAAVKEMLSVLFGEGNGDLEEWWSYGGEPYHFAAVIPVSEGWRAENMRAFLDLIWKIKNVRSHCDGLILQDKTVLKLKTSEGVYKVCPPFCGTYPSVSTGFSQDEADLILQTTNGDYAAPAIKASQIPAGVAPSTSTGFTQDESRIALQTTEGNFNASAAAAGTVPGVSTGFTQDESRIELQTTDGSYSSSPTGTSEVPAGVAPSTSTGFTQDESQLALQTTNGDYNFNPSQPSDNHPSGVTPTTSTGFTQDGVQVTLQGADGSFSSSPETAGQSTGVAPATSTGFEQGGAQVSLQGADGSFSAPSGEAGTVPGVSTSFTDGGTSISLQNTDGSFSAPSGAASDSQSAGVAPATSTGFSGGESQVGFQGADESSSAPSGETGTVPDVSTGYFHSGTIATVSEASTDGGSAPGMTGEADTQE